MAEEVRTREVIDRQYCLRHAPPLPQRYPAQVRQEMALLRPSVVATRHGAELLCGCEHDGPHSWPDGTVVEP